MKYANGKFPLHLMVHLGGDHYLPPATAKRWQTLVADVLEHEGVLLRITPGPNAYRWYEAQVEAREEACARGRCQDAAVPGTSSHGLIFEGQDSAAIDVTNWAAIGKEKFYHYARKHGFEPGYFDWEPWHLIDWAPWETPASTIREPFLTQEATMILCQLDPQTDGRWVLINLPDRTFWQVRNGLQLDAIRSHPDVHVLGGPQPVSMVEGITERPKG